MDTHFVPISELRVPLQHIGPREAIDHRLQKHICRQLGIRAQDLHDYRIERRSIDARRKPKLEFVYQVVAEVSTDSPLPKGQLDDPGASPSHLHDLTLDPDRPQSVIVVGTGPAGIMAAYLLAEHGCDVLVIDRGFDVDRRNQDIADFHAHRTLDTESNYLFGEGGAGTFSDGKLYTRVKDTRMRYVLDAFVKARAPRNIRYHHHPHIGSDILPHMARNLRKEVEARGGRFRWGCAMTDIIERDGRCVGVALANGERLEADACLLAVGHSARTLLRRLAERGIEHKAKGFQLGCRVEHEQGLINQGQYACVEPPPYLGAAEYNLVSRPRQKGTPSTTTFCMCPGGEIIAATSDPGQLSTNGMSKHARNSGFANAGLIVNQPVDRLGDGLAGFDLLDHLEQRCFAAGGGDYSCPSQHAQAFVRGEADKRSGTSSYQLGTVSGRIDELLPPATRDALREALRFFERKIPGFLRHGRLIGLETRVSAPIRFERNPDTLASSLPGCYLAGEGAGYAGGIISAALDGVRLAERMLTGLPLVKNPGA